MQRFSGYSSDTLLLVAGIVLIILAGVFYALNPFIILEERRDDQRHEDLMLIREGLVNYYEDYGSYPASSEDYKIIDAQYGEIGWGHDWKPYLDVVPRDPQDVRRYVYYSNPNLNNQSYVLYASFEHPELSDIACFSDGRACVGVPENATCGEVCNVGISSANISP